MKNIQKKIIVRMVIYFIIIGLLVGLCIYLSSLSTKSEEKHDWLKNDISSLMRKIENLDAKAVELSDAIGIWEALDSEQRKLQGLRISYAKDTMDRLASENYISDLQLSFSKPAIITEEINKDLTTDNVNVVSSDVSVSFSALTDESALNFISLLDKNFPGYMQITSLSFVQSDNVTKEILKKISEGNFPELINVKMTFLWRDFKLKEPKEQEEEAGS